MEMNMDMTDKQVFRLSWLTLIPHLIATVFVVGFVTTPIQVLRILTTKIEVDRNMVYGEVGILNKDIQNSPIKHIQSVRVDRSLLGRILGYGTVRISTAGAGYTYKGMGQPEKLRKLINSYL